MDGTAFAVSPRERGETMIGLEVLRDYANGGFMIPTWEIAFYIAVMSIYALMGRAKSCLINSFAFTFYWGYMYLLPNAFSANGLSHRSLIIYVISGLSFYTLATLALSRRPANGRGASRNSIEARQ